MINCKKKGEALRILNQQMMATSVTVPVMMVFSFLPMLSIFNDAIAKVAKITYSEQIYLLLIKNVVWNKAIDLSLHFFLISGMLVIFGDE